jgi:hypothetical protein
MAKQVIALTQVSNGTMMTISAAFWYVITSGKKTTANASLWSGASAADNIAIQNGDVIEEVQNFPFPIGSLPTTVKDVLAANWNKRNSQINGVGPNLYNGIFLDSVTGWSA